MDNAYDVVFGFRSGKTATGEPSTYAWRAASGYARTARHTCTGTYYALHEMADGHRNPETGKCTSISSQYRLTAIPAFVVEAETQSANEDLVR